MQVSEDIGYRYLPMTKADLMRRAGRDAEAVAAYEAALELTDNAVEREFLCASLGDRQTIRVPSTGDRQGSRSAMAIVIP